MAQAVFHSELSRPSFANTVNVDRSEKSVNEGLECLREVSVSLLHAVVLDGLLKLVGRHLAVLRRHTHTLVTNRPCYPLEEPSLNAGNNLAAEESVLMWETLYEANLSLKGCVKLACAA